MAFVNETLTEQDKAWFESFKITKPWYSRSPSDPQYQRSLAETPSQWTIDRERDAVLVVLGGQGRDYERREEIPLFMSLIWRGKRIHIELYNKGKGNATVGIEEWWRLTSIVIPEELETQTEEIIAMIYEALDTHGCYFDRTIVKAVHIEVLAKPRYVTQ